MWRNICAESPVGRLEYGIKELQEIFQKIKSKPNLRRKTSHQNFGGTPPQICRTLRPSAVRRFKKSTNLLNSDLQLEKHDQMPHVPKSSGSIPRGSFRITWNSPFHMKRKKISCKCRHCLHFRDPLLSRASEQLWGLGPQVQAS